jgi:hypothetical protein
MGLGSEIRDPGSGKNLFRIPDPGVKKAPDPGSGSATLVFFLNFWKKMCFILFLGIDLTFCTCLKRNWKIAAIEICNVKDVSNYSSHTNSLTIAKVRIRNRNLYYICFSMKKLE